METDMPTRTHWIDPLINLTPADLVGWANKLRQTPIVSHLPLSPLPPLPHVKPSPIKPHQRMGISVLPPWSLTPTDPVCAQGSDKRTLRLAWKGAHRAVASAREVVPVTETALLIPNRQRLPCHAGPKMAAGQKSSPSGPSPSLSGWKYSWSGNNYSLKMMRIVAVGGSGRGWHTQLKYEVNYFFFFFFFLSCGQKAQQGRVYTGDRSKCEMTKGGHNARWQVKTYGTVLLD